MLQRSLGVDPATSADIYGSNTWLREVSNTSRIGPDTWPPPNPTIFGYDGLSSPVPFLKLPSAINYTSLTPPKPQYAARFTYGAGTFVIFKSWGANTLTTSNVIREDPGRYKFTVSVPLQDFSMVLVTSLGGSLTYASSRIESNTVWYIHTSYFSTSDDLDVGFVTVP
jgi:hypothetical protein